MVMGSAASACLSLTEYFWLGAIQSGDACLKFNYLVILGFTLPYTHSVIPYMSHFVVTCCLRTHLYKLMRPFALSFQNGNLF